MTNEERAIEIGDLCPSCIGDGINGCGECEKRGKYFGALYMAEWKDQQFKEYLEKERTNYPDFMNGTDTYAFGMKEGYVKAFDKIINELFKEE